MRKIITSALLLFSFLTFTQATEKPTQQPQMSITDVKGNTYRITGTEQGLDIKGLEGKIIFLSLIHI